MEETIKKIVDFLEERTYTKEDIKKLETTKLPQLAEPVIKQVVDLIAERKYREILQTVEMASWPVDPQMSEMSSWSEDDLREAIDGFLELNELPYIDKFGVPCNFHPQYEYHQLSCILYRDGRGFAADYGLTTDGELNDLTLQMEFLFPRAASQADMPVCPSDDCREDQRFTDSYTLRPVFLDVHVM